ncbi:MAG: DUF6056 family protein [Oscillospiraceae bacterium]|nr:DUF6056 family protein [Oscillospiraceae bacterium]
MLCKIKAFCGSKGFNTALLGAFLLSLLPLYMLGMYAVPSADDFAQGAAAAAVWDSTHSILAVLSSAFHSSISIYGRYNGCFTSMFLAAVPPNIFGESCYFITCFISVSALVASNAVFFLWALPKVLGIPPKRLFVIYLAVSFVTVNFVKIPVQMYYWYSAAISYTVLYSLALMLLSLLLVIKMDGKRGKVVLGVLCTALSFLVGGANLITASLFPTVLGLLCLWQIIGERRSFLKQKWHYLAAFLCSALGLLLNVSSPGTQSRSEFFTGTPFFPAIYRSLKYGLIFAKSGASHAFIFVFLLILPFIYRAAKGSKLIFKKPILALAVIYCCYCAQFFAPIYAVGGVEKGRISETCYFGFILAVFSALFYMCGYVHKRLLPLIRSKLRSKQFRTVRGSAIAAFALALLLSFTFTFKASEAASFKALAAIKSGEAALFYSEAVQRTALCRSSRGGDVVIKPYSVKPPLLFFDDITEDTADWRNMTVCKYYGLKSIKLEN